jgi:hypothetical protein
MEIYTEFWWRNILQVGVKTTYSVLCLGCGSGNMGFETQQKYEILLSRRDTDKLWGPPNLLYSGYQRFFPLGCPGWIMTSITHLSTLLSLRMCGAIVLLLLCAFWHVLGQLCLVTSYRSSI